MEEDAGKNLHDVSADGASGVDLNRAGVPLLEIVSEPDLRSADEAVEYLKQLRAILMYLGVNDGNLEEGSFRCDANVSVLRKGADEVRHAVRDQEHELVPLPARGDRLRGPPPGRARRGRAGGSCRRRGSSTRIAARRGSMRSKEEAHDYRYFPEPDLPPVIVERGARGAVPARAARAAARARGALPARPRPLRLRRGAARLGAGDRRVLRRGARGLRPRAGGGEEARELDERRGRAARERARRGAGAPGSSRPRSSPRS